MPTAPVPPPHSLFSMARNKLHSVVSGGVKDSCSLHRWVLLKNSMSRSTTILAAPVEEPAEECPGTDVQHAYRRDEDEAHDDLDFDAFMFPDPDAHCARSNGVGNCENQWLDDLLESLGDDDGDAEVASSVASVSILPVDDDDEPFSPPYSPMSSSDDLVTSAGYFYRPPPIAIPYPVPYPPLHPPLVPTWLQLDSTGGTVSSTSPPLYHHGPALSHYDLEDLDELAVPDAIEDTSDDESDTVSTPCTQSMSSLSPTGRAPVPLPAERRRLSPGPHVYVDMDDAFFYPFELEPPPFHDDARPHPRSDSARVIRPLYQEC